MSGPRSSGAPRTEIVWRPQAGPQHALVQCPLPEVFFGGARGGGKCLPLTEPVLTPFGWRALGEIDVGSQVCAPDGSISRVIGVYRPGVAQTYRVTFSDGAQAVCDDGHIWLGKFVGCRIKRELGWKLWRFEEIRRRFEENKDGRFLIPLTKPVTFTRPRVTKHGDSRPVDPYLLGVLLGDGCLTGDSVRYATVENEIDAYCAAFGSVRIDEGPNRRIVHCKDLIAGLRRLNVWGKGAPDKFVPEAYIWADTASRRAVLQGLMDTDGTVDERGHVYFSSCSARLAADVQTLARSLGFKATVWTKQTAHLPAHQVYIRGPGRADLFRLERKKQRATESSQPHHDVRRIVAIEKTERVEVGCFQVDNPAGLFLTRDFVVTHNTDGVLGKWAIKERRYGAHFNARMFRKATTTSEDAIERAKEIYLPLGAKFNETKLTFRMPHGGRVSFGYLDSVADADAEQGKNRTDAWVEEAGQHASPAAIDRLFGALRSAHGVPTQLILTANPGGAGQHWLADRYGLIPFPRSPKIVDRRLPDGSTHRMAVIPSRITDNAILLKSDPGYVSRLQLVGSRELVRAWLEGDWSAIEGAFFPEWSEAKHVVEPFAIPDHWARFRSMDWGSASPFSVGWWAVASDDVKFQSLPRYDDRHNGGSGGGILSRTIPRGALIRYREWYGASAPNVGLKLTAEQIADGIAEREKGEKIAYGVLDPAAFKQDGGPSWPERMAIRQPSVQFMPADNARVSRIGSLGGWDMMRQRLRGDGERPMLYVFSTCRALIRQIATAQHDQARPEDLQTDAEDHALDECFAAGTMVETIDGPRAIETLSSGVVLTIDDRYVPFCNARRTRKKAEVVQLTFADGSKIVCTPNHKFLVDRDEWCYASDLAFRSVLCSQSWSARQSKNFEASATTGAADISSGVAGVFIEKFGKQLTARFHRVFTFITSITTRPIMLSATWNASLAGITWRGGMVTLQQSERWRILTRSMRQLLRGTEVKVASAGIPLITKGTLGLSCSGRSGWYASSAEVASTETRPKQRTPNSVVLHAKRALCVGVEALSEPADVYCLTVPSTEAFALSGGMIVHNCRYGCMSRPWIRNAPDRERTRSDPYRESRSASASGDEWMTL